MLRIQNTKLVLVSNTSINFQIHYSSNVNLVMLLQFENVKEEYNSKMKEMENKFDLRLRSLREQVRTLTKFFCCK